MTQYVHDYNPPLKYGSLIQQKEIEGTIGATWTKGTFTGDGVTLVFSLPTTPATNSLLLFVNGQLQAEGGTDYTLSGTTVTFVVAPLSSDTIVYKYTS